MDDWYHHNGERTVLQRPGDYFSDLIQGFGRTPQEAVADFWDNVRLEAERGRERDADPDMPLTNRQILAMSLLGQEPTNYADQALPGT